MKRFLSLVLMISLLFSVISLAACQPTEDQPSSTSSQEETTTVPATKEPQAQPEPDDPDYTYVVLNGEAQITGYTGTSTDLVLPAWAGGVPVTSIAPMLFMNNETITSVVLPGSLKVTGQLAFYNCTALKKVVLSEGITTVTMGTFDDCPLLSDITLPSTLTSIEDVAFQGCISLKKIELPASLTHLGYKCFGTCSLEEVVIPEGCGNIEPAVFKDNPYLKSVTFLCHCTTIPNNCFECCFALENVQLPAETESLGEYCFYRCESLKTLDCGKCNYFCIYALWGCLSLETLSIHSTHIYRFCGNAFSFDPKLTDIYYAGTLEDWNSIRRDEYNYALDSLTVHTDWAE